jgi:hypothetical protein
MDAIKQIEKTLKGVTYRLSIYQDEDVGSPREDCDLAGRMVCWHSRYTLGDVRPAISPAEWMRVILGHDGLLVEETDQDKLYEKMKKKFIVLPLFLFDHSGITMSTSSFSDPWDSGQVGLIYISKEDAVKEWGAKKFTKDVEKRAIKYLIGEVEIYDMYLRGECYQYVIELKEVCNLGHTHWKIVDSCCGFLGSDFKENGMLENMEAKFVTLFKKELLK